MPQRGDRHWDLAGSVRLSWPQLGMPGFRQHWTCCNQGECPQLRQHRSVRAALFQANRKLGSSTVPGDVASTPPVPVPGPVIRLRRAAAWGQRTGLCTWQVDPAGWVKVGGAAVSTVGPGQDGQKCQSAKLPAPIFIYPRPQPASNLSTCRTCKPPRAANSSHGHHWPVALPSVCQPGRHPTSSQQSEIHGSLQAFPRGSALTPSVACLGSPASLALDRAPTPATHWKASVPAKSTQRAC